MLLFPNSAIQTCHLHLYKQFLFLYLKINHRIQVLHTFARLSRFCELYPGNIEEKELSSCYANTNFSYVTFLSTFRLAKLQDFLHFTEKFLHSHFVGALLETFLVVTVIVRKSPWQRLKPAGVTEVWQQLWHPLKIGQILLLFTEFSGVTKTPHVSGGKTKTCKSSRRFLLEIAMITRNPVFPRLFHIQSYILFDCPETYQSPAWINDRGYSDSHR